MLPSWRIMNPRDPLRPFGVLVDTRLPADTLGIWNGVPVMDPFQRGIKAGHWTSDGRLILRIPHSLRASSQSFRAAFRNDDASEVSE